MKRWVVVGLTVVFLAVTLVGSRPQQAAVAADVCTPRFTPNVVAVGLEPAVVPFSVPVVEYEGCGYVEQGWNVRLNRWGVDVSNRAPLAIIDPDYLPNSDTKPVSGEIRFLNAEKQLVNSQVPLPYSFRLVHQTTWGSSFTVKRVDATHLKVSGTLTRADWEQGRYERYPRRHVKVVQSETHALATPTLDARGHFSVTVKADDTGYLNAIYGGNSTSSGAVSPSKRPPT